MAGQKPPERWEEYGSPSLGVETRLVLKQRGFFVCGVLRGAFCGAEPLKL